MRSGAFYAIPRKLIAFRKKTEEGAWESRGSLVSRAAQMNWNNTADMFEIYIWTRHASEVIDSPLMGIAAAMRISPL